MIRRIGLVAALMAFPMPVAYVTSSTSLIIAAFYFTPLLSVIGVTIALSYLIVFGDRRFPFFSALPSLLVCIASAFNFYAAYILGSSFDGGNC